MHDQSDSVEVEMGNDRFEVDSQAGNVVGVLARFIGVAPSQEVERYDAILFRE